VTLPLACADPKRLKSYIFISRFGENMRILKATRNNILATSQIVDRGGLVVYPTETVYGLGCDPFNIKAVKRVFKVKGERRKPLPILASNISHVERIAYMSHEGKRIAGEFWPGPLTLIFPKKSVLLDTVTCNLDSVGVRVPKHDVALQLISLSNGLLIGTSANRTGETPPQTIREVSQQLKEEVDVILDDGSTTLGKPSTVIDLTSKVTRVLRDGPVSLEVISNFISADENSTQD
jgi:L-threonylcarbamoyladenylate synthase